MINWQEVVNLLLFMAIGYAMFNIVVLLNNFRITKKRKEWKRKKKNL